MTMTKEEFLRSLGDCYTRLVPTEHGVGVVAIRDIPSGVDPFVNCAPIDTIFITEEDLHTCDPAVAKLVRDMCVKQNGVYDAPAQGIDAIGKNYYLNHSETPNMQTNDGGDTFVTSRDIKVGEELTVDYRTYDELGADFLQ